MWVFPTVPNDLNTYTASTCNYEALVASLSDAFFESPLNGIRGSGSWRANDWGREAWFKIHLAATKPVTELTYMGITVAIHSPGTILLHYFGSQSFVNGRRNVG